jgi:hypothetical protein
MEPLHLDGSTEAWRQVGEEDVAKHELGRIEALGYLSLLPLALHAFAINNPHIESRTSVSSFHDPSVASQQTASLNCIDSRRHEYCWNWLFP